jgi:hypothetical protein
VCGAARVNKEHEFGYAWTHFRGGSNVSLGKEKEKDKKKEKRKEKKKEKGEEKERKTLVVSGIGEGEEEAVRKWCEAFGEVKAFERRGKDSLIVDFKKTSVADTVSHFIFYELVCLI